MSEEKSLTLKCLSCGNEENFEIEEADWATDEDSTKHFLVEKVKCVKCGAVYRAKYELVSWQQDVKK